MGLLDAETYYKSFPTLSNKRNRFPFEKEINWNMKLGEITPICIIRTVPGQTYDLDISTIIKVAPLQVPPMQSAIFKTFAFYQPDRNNWVNYKYWFGEKQKPENPEEEPTYLMPKVKMPTGGFAYNSFYDNIGCVPEKGGYSINAVIPRADRQIYNYYFRNQSLENPLEINNGDQDDNPNQNMALRKICKQRDLFTSCLPTQSGTSPVEIPLGTTAPVYGKAGTALILQPSDGNPKGANYRALNKTGTTNPNLQLSSTLGNALNVNIISKEMAEYNKITGNVYADLSAAAGAPLEGLYQAIAYNTFQYLTSRGGNRYFEHISNIYGVVNPDGVLQQPEFLGSTQQPIEFDTVTQTSSTENEATPLANRAANGYCQDYGSIVTKSFGEFGYIYIYGVVTIENKYQQGVSRLLQEDDPLDLFNPIFNLMGDEAIYQSEIYVQDDSVVDEEGNPANNKVFGYGKRNSRLLYPVDEIHGEQRSSYAQSLDTSHFAEYYTKAPTLNKEFDKVSDAGFKRALMVTNETQFICNTVISGIQDIQIPIGSIPSPIPEVLLNQN